MARSQAKARILSSALTVIGLGLVWIAVATHWPSQDELLGGESSPTMVAAAGHPSPIPTPSPELDLTIPASPPLPNEVPVSEPFVAAPLGDPSQQVTQLKCEAEIEQLCPDGAGRMQCLRRKSQHIPAMCQQLVRERFVKWKEDRSRFVAACEADTKRFCSAVKHGGGQILQCLQEHAQDLAEQCYQILPKGKLSFRQ